ncbi:putative G-actin binding protein [Leishmania major strain Friedlin]|uniref:Putative G-actin binding protein n=1 Tax=Leishmania major TaxID=5664 RepID=Q4Q2X1_LEIMA|nr:putative G-actin binding protein [Leishmania major strain Friedlin]CAG9582101.1 twinfilin_-_putative [Leishmania major strain Friedlin]CAJ07942.1 putative G-actin binding protein [Leishmania major strain Friedlin]|eukprot:XP_001686327.1 putative G-actin binding protein [Leishmania major strain Friedlin]
MLHIDFCIAADAQEALEESGKPNTATVAVPIILEKEVLKLLAPPVCSSDGGFEYDLNATRTLLGAKGATAAYIVVRTAPSTQYVVIYVSDTTSAKNRMLYSTGLSRVVEATPHAQKRTVRISSVSELLPSLFEAESKKVKEALMTESERHHAAIARMEVAPQPVALPGVAVQITTDADDGLSQFAGGAVEVATFKIEAGQLQLDKTVAQLNGNLDQVKSILTDADPRFVLLRYPSPKTQLAEAVMVYVCPPTCSPKIKIQYASSAAAFREQALRHKIQLAHKVETDTTATLADDVRSAFEPFPSADARKTHGRLSSCPPTSWAPKGHSMLI